MKELKPIKGQKSKLTNESNKEEIYSKILDSILNLLVWNLDKQVKLNRG